MKIVSWQQTCIEDHPGIDWQKNYDKKCINPLFLVSIKVHPFFAH